MRHPLDRGKLILKPNSLNPKAAGHGENGDFRVPEQGKKAICRLAWQLSAHGLNIEIANQSTLGQTGLMRTVIEIHKQFEKNRTCFTMKFTTPSPLLSL